MERAYLYDTLGNMIQEEADECLEYHYHGATLYESRECCERAEYNGIKRWDYTYDGRGNLVSVDKYQRTTQGMQLVNSEKYVYDETNRLVQGTNEDGEVSRYTYNGLGVRVGRELIVKDNTHGYTDFHKQTPSVETGLDKPEVVKEDYVIDYTRLNIDQRVLMKSEEGGYDFRWVYGLDALQVKVTGPGSDWWGQQEQTDILTAYTHHDRLGSIVNLTDKYGRNIARADYREYGEIAFYESITVSGGYRRIAPQLVYTNHEWDDVLDLYYAKARFYDADDKRFLSMDPVKGRITDPQSLVPYVYCIDNPLKWTDPLGMYFIYEDRNGNYFAQAESGTYGLLSTKLAGLPGDLLLSVKGAFDMVHGYTVVGGNSSNEYKSAIEWVFDWVKGKTKDKAIEKASVLIKKLFGELGGEFAGVADDFYHAATFWHDLQQQEVIPRIDYAVFTMFELAGVAAPSGKDQGRVATAVELAYAFVQKNSFLFTMPAYVTPTKQVFGGLIEIPGPTAFDTLLNLYQMKVNGKSEDEIAKQINTYWYKYCCDTSNKKYNPGLNATYSTMSINDSGQIVWHDYHIYKTFLENYETAINGLVEKFATYVHNGLLVYDQEVAKNESKQQNQTDKQAPSTAPVKPKPSRPGVGPLPERL